MRIDLGAEILPGVGAAGIQVGMEIERILEDKPTNSY
jgi:hypothetical protein